MNILNGNYCLDLLERSNMNPIYGLLIKPMLSMEPDHRPTVSYISKILSDVRNSSVCSNLESTEHHTLQMTGDVTNLEVQAFEETYTTFGGGPSGENSIVLDKIGGAEVNIEVKSSIFS